MIARILIGFTFFFFLKAEDACSSIANLYEEYDIKCKHLRIVSNNMSVYSMEKGSKEYFLVLYLSKRDFSQERYRDVSLSIFDKGDINFRQYLIYKQETYAPLLDLLADDNVEHLNTILLGVLEEVKLLHSFEVYHPLLALENIVVDPKAKRAKLIGIMPTADIYDKQNEIDQLRQLISDFQAACKRSLYKEDKTVLQTAFTQLEAFKKHINSIQVENYELGAVIDQFRFILKSSNKNKDPIDGRTEDQGTKLRYSDKKEDLGVNINFGNKRAAILILLLSMLFLVVLVLTIYLVADKEANITEEDLEMRNNNPAMRAMQ